MTLYYGGNAGERVRLEKISACVLFGLSLGVFGKPEILRDFGCRANVL